MWGQVGSRGSDGQVSSIRENSVEQRIQQAIALHQRNSIAEAEEICLDVLRVAPGHTVALHLLGVIRHQQGRLDEAIRLIRESLDRNPHIAEAHNNLGVALKAENRLTEAVESYRRAIAVRPDFAEAHGNLGIALKALGRLDEAIDSYRQAIALNPEYHEAHSDLGTALNGKGRLDEAVDSYRRAIALRPNYAEAHANLGIALMLRGQLDEAVESYRRAIALKPGIPQAHKSLGDALMHQGKSDEAIASYRNALAHNPDWYHAHGSLANALLQRGELDGAIASYRHGLALKPGWTQGHSNLGHALTERGRLDEAIDSCSRAIALEPNFPAAHTNLGNALKQKGRIEEAVQSYQRAIALAPDSFEAHSNLGSALMQLARFGEAIHSFRRALALKPDYTKAHSNLVFSHLYLPETDARSILREHLLWGQQHAQPLVASVKSHPNSPDPNRRLRVGYISADFREHSVGFFLLPVLSLHDPEHVEVFCYSNSAKEDEYTVRFRNAAHVWRSIVGVGDDEAARMIRDEGIDILVDLSGHTAQNRLLIFARKPAPIQMSWIGYPGTTGVPGMDYLIGDSVVTPADGPLFLSEQPLRLPHCFLCFEPSEYAPPVSSLPALTNDVITFGCFAGFQKVNSQALDLWARVLHEVPESRLYLKNRALQDESIRDKCLSHFGKLGIAPERILLEGWSPLKDYLACYNDVDISLDTFPFSGGTTTCQSLWQGVPVVTLRGGPFSGRMSASILNSAGLTDWIAGHADEYLEIAVSWARDISGLASIRGNLRARVDSSPLCDAPKFTQNLEAAFREVWREWCKGTERARDLKELDGHATHEVAHGSLDADDMDFNSVSSVAQAQVQAVGSEQETLPETIVFNVGRGARTIALPPHYERWRHDLLDSDQELGTGSLLDAGELSSLPQHQYDAVYCSHYLEHFHPHEIPKVLAGFLHVLKPDGFAEIIVPDLQAVAERWITDRMDIEDILYESPTGPISIRDVFYGGGKDIECGGGNHFAHNTGFTPKSLAAILSASGFVSVHLQRSSFSVRAVAFTQIPDPDLLESLGIT